MASEIRDNVKEYYGKVLATNENLQTNACVQVEKVPKRVREAISLCHEDVLSKYDFVVYSVCHFSVSVSMSEQSTSSFILLAKQG